jgi:Cu-Zn family superoxide dismutase
MMLQCGWRGWLLVALALAGCATGAARARLVGTQPGSPIRGEVRLTQITRGLRVEAEVSGVPPGRHGFHIHERGDCAEGGNAAGGHFNPDQVKHGELARDGHAGAHAGDFGNLEVDADGRGTFTQIFPTLSLAGGPYAVTGRAVILHANRDDFSQPTGNAGGRIACGVIAPGG